MIGLGCRLPGDVGGPEALWQFLCEARSAVGEVPPDRWAAFEDGSPEAVAALSGTTRWGSFLSRGRRLRRRVLRDLAVEAVKMDPQQRLAAGGDSRGVGARRYFLDGSLRRTQTGVFDGCLFGRIWLSGVE